MATRVGYIIKKRRQEKEMSQRQVALYAEISNAEISRIESGIREHPAAAVLQRIANVLDIPVEDLYRATGYLPDEPRPAPAAKKGAPEELQFINIPVVGKVSAGELADAIEYADEFIAVPKQSGADFALCVCGDSMEPFYRHGDVVLVKKQAVAGNEDHVVARVEDQVTVKIFHKYDHTIMLRAANPMYKPIEGTDIRIIGIVRGVIYKPTLRTC